MPTIYVALRASVLLLALAAASPAFAVCRDVTHSATGAEKATAEEATEAAGAALQARIARTHGPTWGVGSHRYGSFHCDKHLAGRKPGWVCSAKTTVICSR